MKKSLIALAVAGVIAAPAAMADVTIYGAANVSFDAVSNGVVGNSVSSNHVSSNVSKIGFKGSEDLGDGLSAIWQIEQQVNIDNSTANTAPTNTVAVPGTAPAAQVTPFTTPVSNGFGTRNTFAGLSSTSMGTVLLGRHDTPYKIATRGLDLFGDTVADNRSIMGLGGVHDARLTDVIAYISPAMNGVTVALATVTGAETAANGGAGATKGGAYSLAAMYNAAGINASLSYQVIDNGTANTGSMGAILGNQAIGAAQNKATAWKLGGSYTMDALQFNGIYEKTGSSGAIANAHDRSTIYLGGKYSFGNDAVKLAYTSAGKLNSAVNTESNQLSLGYDHSLSKRTTVYALYSKISNKSAMNATFSQATSAAGAVATADADPSVFSLGMKHSF